MEMLSNNEFEIMSLLWAEERPLSRSEIIELSPNKHWKERSIHVLLNSLLDKGMIEVSGFASTRTNIGRVFLGALFAEEYMAFLLRSGGQKATLHAGRLFSALHAQGALDDDSIEELEQIIRTLRAQSGGGAGR